MFFKKYFSITALFSPWLIVRIMKKHTHTYSEWRAVFKVHTWPSVYPVQLWHVLSPSTLEDLGLLPGGPVSHPPPPAPGTFCFLLLCSLQPWSDSPGSRNVVSPTLCQQFQRTCASFILVSFLEGKLTQGFLRDVASCFLLTPIRGQGAVAQKEREKYSALCRWYWLGVFTH